MTGYRKELKALGAKAFFATAIFVASVLVLAFKLLNPTPVQIFVQGETVVMSQVPGLFTYNDVLTIALAMMFTSISASYLMLGDSSAALTTSPQSSSPGDVLLKERRERWEEVAKTLKNNEQRVYKAIVDEGIISQSELINRTGLSKSNVSRALYGLESRGLVERRRQGMGNVVVLK
jgi:uncharacterized membrane protein